MANNVPWPPNAVDLQNKLLAGVSPLRIHPLIEESIVSPIKALTDAELEQVRRDNHNDARIDRWAPRGQMGWIMRQPVEERLLYVRETSTSNLLIRCSRRVI